MKTQKRKLTLKKMAISKLSETQLETLKGGGDDQGGAGGSSTAPRSKISDCWYC